MNARNHRPDRGREPGRYRDARRLLRSVRPATGDEHDEAHDDSHRDGDAAAEPLSSAASAVSADGVRPDRWSVDIDDESAELADALDLDAGTPIPVDASSVFGQFDAFGNDDTDDADGDDGAPGGALIPSRPGDRDPGGGAARVVPWSGRAVHEREVIPAWLRSAEERRAAAAYAKTRAWHLSKYHGTRVPLYAARLAGRAPAGAGRVLSTTARWASDAESRELRQRAAKGTDAAEYLRMADQHREVVRGRTTLVLIAATLVALGTGVVFVAAGTGAQVLFVAFALVVLGVIGRSPDRPVIDHAVVTPRARKLTADIVLRAFTGAGLCKDDDPITFPQPIQRDGHGWRAVIDLPYGKTAEAAIKKRTAVASGLDLDEVQVWLDRVRGTSGSARRVVLWVADEDPYAKPSGPWPWLTAGAGGTVKPDASIFEPFPFGQDQRGRPVPLSLMFTWVLVGAIPRMGKTYAARLMALAAALDPYVRLHVYDGKGGIDWNPFAQVAHRFAKGARKPTVVALLEDLRQIKEDMNASYDKLDTLPEALCPEGKITPQLARSVKHNIRPVVIVIDEFQRYTEDAEHGKEIVDLLVDLAKVGPAVGIMGVLATQKPDTDSIPTKLRDVIGTRFCLNVATWQSSDAALGAGMYSAGIDASRFQRAHKGVGWLVGADDSGAVEEAVTVRTALAGPDDVARVITAAHAARLAAGTLSGQAVGELPTRPEKVSVVADIAAVFAAGEDRLWSELIVHRLTELRPGFYDGWNAAQLATAVKPHGLSTVQVWGSTGDGQPANRRGLTREAVMDTLRTLQTAPATQTAAQNPHNPQNRPQDRLQDPPQDRPREITAEPADPTTEATEATESGDER